jgi:hypothetical protein
MSKTPEVLCRICGAKFADVLYLKQHQSSAHGPEEPETTT